MQDLYPFLPIICHYHGNILLDTVEKMCLVHLHPKAHICAKFHGNWSKTEEEVCDARFETDRWPARVPTCRFL